MLKDSSNEKICVNCEHYNPERKKLLFGYQPIVYRCYVPGVDSVRIDHVTGESIKIYTTCYRNDSGKCKYFKVKTTALKKFMEHIANYRLMVRVGRSLSWLCKPIAPGCFGLYNIITENCKAENECESCFYLQKCKSAILGKFPCPA